MTDVLVGSKAETPKKGMTLRELAAFLKECVDHGLDLDDNVPRVTTNIKGKLRSIDSR